MTINYFTLNQDSRSIFLLIIDFIFSLSIIQGLIEKKFDNRNQNYFSFQNYLIPRSHTFNLLQMICISIISNQTNIEDINVQQ